MSAELIDGQNNNAIKSPRQALGIFVIEFQILIYRLVSLN
jgi:hypothetical protein